MKRLEITVPLLLLEDLGILSQRFFRNNASVEVLQSFPVRPGTAALVVRVRRRGPFKDLARVRREAVSLAALYRLERFEILSADKGRGEYVAWIAWALPRILRGQLGVDWEGVVPLSVSQAGPAEARVVILASERFLPRLRSFLDDAGAPYQVRSVRTPAAATWDPLAGLTPRQRALLEIAYRLGYYETPSRATLSRIGALVGITKAAVSKHLRAAEPKLVAASLGGRGSLLPLAGRGCLLRGLLGPCRGARLRHALVEGHRAARRVLEDCEPARARNLGLRHEHGAAVCLDSREVVVDLF